MKQNPLLNIRDWFLDQTARRLPPVKLLMMKYNAGLFLKDIFDMRLPHKFIISGSGSLKLKAKIPESMAGRKQMFMVDPVSFEEFVNFKTNYRLRG